MERRVERIDRTTNAENEAKGLYDELGLVSFPCKQGCCGNPNPYWQIQIIKCKTGALSIFLTSEAE
jgi:hypothetical protein